MLCLDVYLKSQPVSWLFVFYYTAAVLDDSFSLFSYHCSLMHFTMILRKALLLYLLYYIIYYIYFWLSGGIPVGTKTLRKDSLQKYRLRPQPTRRTSWKLVGNPGSQHGLATTEFPTSSPSGLLPLAAD